MSALPPVYVAWLCAALPPKRTSPLVDIGSSVSRSITDVASSRMSLISANAPAVLIRDDTAIAW